MVSHSFHTEAKCNSEIAYRRTQIQLTYYMLVATQFRSCDDSYGGLQLKNWFTLSVRIIEFWMHAGSLESAREEPL